jgi:hypothetical protein
MLGDRDFAGRTLDKRPQTFAREPTDFHAKALGLGAQLRPIGEALGRRVEEPEQAARRAMVDVRPSLGGHHAALVSQVQITPI